MDCERIQPLICGYLDGELDEEKCSQVKAHLEQCSQCRQDWADFTKMKEVTRSMKFPEPTDRQLEIYWRNIYNRMERSFGWILLSLGVICLLGYGGFVLSREILLNPEVPLIMRLGLVGVIFGVIILLVSIARERLKVRKADRYSQEVER